MRDENCIFCKIANGEIPSRTLYEDDAFRVILSPYRKHMKIYSGTDLLKLLSAEAVLFLPMAKHFIRKNNSVSQKNIYSRLQNLGVPVVSA